MGILITTTGIPLLQYPTVISRNLLGFEGWISALGHIAPLYPTLRMVGPNTSWAVRIRRGDIVQMFLEQEDVASDTTDKGSRMPLSWAAINGRGGIVQLLLEWEDVTSDSGDKGGSTPLSMGGYQWECPWNVRVPPPTP